MTDAPVLETPSGSPLPSPALEPAVDPVAEAQQLSLQQWRALARLCRALEAADPILIGLLGPQARVCAQALRGAQAAWRRRRGDPAASLRRPPLRTLAALAAAARGLAQRASARPVGYFKPAGCTLGPGLLLQMPAMKAWLQTDFPQAAAVRPDTPEDEAAARAADAVVRQCLALCGAEDSLDRRVHLLQLLDDHGHREPLLRLVRRAGHAWLPAGWADNWEQLTGTGQDRAMVEALRAAMVQATPELEGWTREPKPATPSPTGVPTAEESVTPWVDAHGPRPQAGRPPLILRAAQLPRRVRWGVGAAVALVLALGLALQLTAGNGASNARWVIFHVDDAKTMAIDPASIRRDGQFLTYRVGVVWLLERRSSVAVFTADCVTRERRLETVQHYSGKNYETATRYEVRGTPASPWPPTGADIALLRAACAQA